MVSDKQGVDRKKSHIFSLICLVIFEPSKCNGKLNETDLYLFSYLLFIYFIIMIIIIIFCNHDLISQEYQYLCIFLGSRHFIFSPILKSVGQICILVLRSRDVSLPSRGFPA